MTTVVVTGGRDLTDAVRIAEVLTALHIRYGFHLLVHGNAPGLDKLADAWAIRNGIPTRAYHADWGDITAVGAVVRFRRDGSKYNSMAGPDRNQRMIDQSHPDVGVAFPGDIGTADCTRRMQDYKKRRPTFVLIEVPPSGPLPIGRGHLAHE